MADLGVNRSPMMPAGLTGITPGATKRSLRRMKRRQPAPGLVTVA
jgi:hypothetical protein